VDVDLELVRRLETSAAIASLDLIAAIRLLDPTTAAEGREFLGGALIAMGPGRYVNRAIGVSTADLSSDDVDAIEQFFSTRGLPPMMELSSWAPASTLQELAKRNYTPAWFRSVFALRPGPNLGPLRTDVRIERVDDRNAAQWLEVFARGFEAEHGETRVSNDEIGEAGRIAPNAHTFLAFLDDEAVGCGSMQVVDDVAWLGGAATVPAFRKRGVQAALVAYRLQLASELGCELAAVTALSSGPSARNIMRLGFPHTHSQVVVEQRRAGTT
jgi:GNAT superfamily N-acetyltransferase